MPEAPRTTGRSIVGFAMDDPAAEDHFRALVSSLESIFAVRSELAIPERVLRMPNSGAHYYPAYKFAIVPYLPEQVREAKTHASGIEWVEPERIVEMNARPLLGIAAAPQAAITWGLDKTGVSTTPFTGKNVRIAVLDTGFDFDHPDFPESRFGEKKSFVPEPVHDRINGHGTHTTGTACGPRNSEGTTRYGIAHESTILVARVLNEAGLGTDQNVLDGLLWAAANNADIVMMCFGQRVLPGTPFSKCYERVASSMASRTLLIAAAGNDHDPNKVEPVQHPANCPSIRAVASLNTSLAPSLFSCGTVTKNGGEADIAAPGENIRSSVPVNRGKYFAGDGTSMAAAHVAGIAALWAEKEPAKRGHALWNVIFDGGDASLGIPKQFGGCLTKAPQ